jgi:thymidine kinase
MFHDGVHRGDNTVMAKLYFRYSAMNAGKTTQLVQVKYNYEERGQNVLVLKPSIDKRDCAGKIKSRIGIECNAIVFDSSADVFTLVRGKQEKQKIDCILIDEAQFLTKEQVMQVCSVVDDLNIPCMAYGLRSDFK